MTVVSFRDCFLSALTSALARARRFVRDAFLRIALPIVENAPIVLCENPAR
jgi:hypothetical protein